MKSINPFILLFSIIAVSLFFFLFLSQNIEFCIPNLTRLSHLHEPCSSVYLSEKCIYFFWSNYAERRDHYSYGKLCGDEKICDGEGNCVDYWILEDESLICETPGETKYDSLEEPCLVRVSEKKCSENNFWHLLTERVMHYDSGISCSENQVCDGKGNCIDSFLLETD